MYICIVCMYEHMYVGVFVCEWEGAGIDPGLPVPKTYAILEAILRKKNTKLEIQGSVRK